MRERSPTPQATTRRQFLGAAPKPTGGHIASLLVQAWPEKTAVLDRHLQRIPGVDTHGGAAGKLIVTVEAENDGQLMELIGAIEAADGVIAASLVYHQMEEAEND